MSILKHGLSSLRRVSLSVFNDKHRVKDEQGKRCYRIALSLFLSLSLSLSLSLP